MTTRVATMKTISGDNKYELVFDHDVNHFHIRTIDKRSDEVTSLVDISVAAAITSYGEYTLLRVTEDRMNHFVRLARGG